MKARYSLLVFLGAFTSLVSYVFLTNSGYILPSSVFWVSILVTAITIVFQILWSDMQPKVLLFEVFLFTFMLHLMLSISGPGLVGHDPHFEFSSAQSISQNGWPIVDTSLPDRVINYSEWPLLQIVATLTSNVTGIDLLLVAKYLSPLIGSFAVFFVFLLSRTIYGNRSAILISFATSTLFWYVFFDSRFVRETLGITLFFAGLYLFVSAFKTGSSKKYFLTIISVIALVFAHHFTSFDFLLFAVIFSIALVVLKTNRGGFRFFANRKVLSKYLVASGPVVFITALLIMLNLTYWLFVGLYIPDTLSLMIGDLKMSFGYHYSISLIGGSFRSTFVSYADIIIIALLGIVTLHELLRKINHKESFDLIFFLWGTVIIGIAYVAPYFGPLVRFDFTRFLAFGFPLFLIVGLNALMKIKSKYLTRYFVAGFVIFFVLVQVFTIPAYFYDKSASPEYSTGGYREYYLPSEYRAVEWSNLTGQVVAGDWSCYELFGGYGGALVSYEQNSVVEIFKGNLDAIQNYDWFVFRQEDLLGTRVGSARVTSTFATSAQTLHIFYESPLMQKIYSNDQIDIYYIDRGF